MSFQMSRDLEAVLQFKIFTKRNDASKQFQLISSASFIFTKIHRYNVYFYISKIYIDPGSIF